MSLSLEWRQCKKHDIGGLVEDDLMCNEKRGKTKVTGQLDSDSTPI